MANLKDLKSRIASVKNNAEDHEGAMQMVAAAKLRRAQEAAENGPSLCRAHAQRCWPSIAKSVGADEACAEDARWHRRDNRQLLVVVSTGPAGCAVASTASIVREDP